jgi:CAAX prenyl protease-like protein
LLSILVGLAVFLLWIAPDILIPNYRTSPLFANTFVGHLHSSLSAQALSSPWVLIWRTGRAVLIVPVVEELFWRGWMMRWIIHTDFEKVRFGTYAPAAFWITAILFASEHGPYWDVGLLTGILYNLWMIRTKSLADCILMHAVTNGVLSAYVIATGQWQYWQ